MERDEDISGRDEAGASPSLDRSGEPFDDEPIDEELLVLRVPPPSPRQALFILAVLGLSVFMLIWFFPDLRYLLRGFGEVRDLGEAADLGPGDLRADSFVRLRGIPMTNRTLVFSKGVRWFRDNERKVFPLAGFPGLLVEWRVPAAKRAYRDPHFSPGSVRLPFEFQGRLVPRAELGARYEKLWLFYDCLEGYSTIECRLCFGAAGLDDCRRRIACALEVGEDCRAILANPGDERNAAVDRKEAELVIDEARRFHDRLTELAAGHRRKAASLERDLADLESGRMIPRIEEEIAGWRKKLERARAEERRLLERLERQRGLDAGGLRAAAERAAAELEDTRVEIRDLVRRAEAARADAGAFDAGAPADVADRLAELEARRDGLLERVEADRELIERLQTLSRLGRERDALIAELENSLADARSGAMLERLATERDLHLKPPAVIEAGAQRIEEIGGILAAAAPGDPVVAQALGELRRLQRDLGHSRWVLVDGEIPLDNSWVVLVYAIFLLMIASNLRHIYRFWRAWRG